MRILMNFQNRESRYLERFEIPFPFLPAIPLNIIEIRGTNTKANDRMQIAFPEMHSAMRFTYAVCAPFSSLRRETYRARSAI